jgi:hypothetical protein
MESQDGTFSSRYNEDNDDDDMKPPPPCFLGIVVMVGRRLCRLRLPVSINFPLLFHPPDHQASTWQDSYLAASFLSLPTFAD